ncbi:hypothetical protein KCP74_22000 [Salmonella enterica subsp. enterica]|nr:hypothetical protein KCP74_22000 [Salmonella enterica subsp. enterica]
MVSAAFAINCTLSIPVANRNRQRRASSQWRQAVTLWLKWLTKSGSFRFSARHAFPDRRIYARISRKPQSQHLVGAQW